MTAERPGEQVDHDDHDIPAVTFDLDDADVVVIIGSGAGGGTLADELTQKGINVVVLEAGRRFKMSDFVNDEWEMTDKLSWPDKRVVTGSAPLAKAFPNAPTWVCKGVGGTTLHWAGMCPRFKPYEFKTRTTYGSTARTLPIGRSASRRSNPTISAPKTRWA